MFKHRPIISNRYAQEETFPSHVRGPNYTRPVFDEYGPYGNFQPAPIMVFPGGRSLNGSEAQMKSGGIFSQNQSVLGIGGIIDDWFGGEEDSGTAEGGTSYGYEAATGQPYVPAEGGTSAGAKIIAAAMGKKTASSPSTGGGGVNKASNYAPATGAKASLFDSPMTWIVLAAVGAVGVYYVTKKK